MEAKRLFFERRKSWHTYWEVTNQTHTMQSRYNSIGGSSPDSERISQVAQGV
jgi:hypothetical protein